MLLIFALAFLLKRYGVQAIPLPDPPAGFSPPFYAFSTSIFVRDDPSASGGCHRTVLDILWSCIATTFACTWVSVHPNVPWKGEGHWTIVGRRIYLMLFSILAPEFMVMWAFKQWRGARMIRETINNSIKEAYQGREDHRPKLWTTAHGHLLQMGGFRICTTASENFFFQDKPPNVFHRNVDDDTGNPNDNSDEACVLPTAPRPNSFQAYNNGDIETANKTEREEHIIMEFEFYRREELFGSGQTHSYEYEETQRESDELIWEGALRFVDLKRLLEDKLIRLPTVSEDEINDRSKGDALSKGIALLQLTWFVVQIVTRAAQGLAISELELTTAALAGMNSIMYFFWWSKPRDVRFPVEIRTKGAEKLLAGRPIDDVEWSFSDDGFSFRKHLWGLFRETIMAFGSFSSLRFRNMLGRLSKGTKTVSQSILAIYTSITVFLKISRGIGEATGYAPSVPSVMEDPGTDEKEGGKLLDEGGHGSPEGDSRTGDITVMTSNNESKHSECRLKRVATSAIESLFSLLSFVFLVIDIALVFPISKVVGRGDGMSLSETLKGSRSDIESIDRTFEMIFYSEDAHPAPLFCTSSIAGILFGAIHCLAWSFSFFFPSHTEKIMWRAASLGVVGSCYSTFGVITWISFDRGPVSSAVAFFLILTALPIMGFVPIVYPIARITLLILAATSMRSLHPSTLDTIDWVEVFPHI